MNKIIASIYLLLSVSVFSQNNNKTVRQILEKVNIDSLKTYVNILSGEISTQINGKELKIKNRYTYNSSKFLAAEYIEQKLIKNGLDTYKQDFHKEQVNHGRNVYGIKYGKMFPDSFIIICAHYDDISFQGEPTGADDNASGVAAVIEASRLLKEMTSNYSIIFALWDKEEVGLMGSNYFAENFSKIENVISVINIDMIGYNTDGDDTIEVHTNEINNSVELAYFTKDIIKNYDLKLSADITNPGTTYSDHSSFWDEGITAILLIEEYWNDDFNDCLHQPCDKINKFNFDYFEECTKLIIATVSELALKE
ncbi:MAG: M20/M25/M40 family metallo-hydrolase [Ignavibacteriales bacterium]|nr:M20/M25/M40 family metallo-hydrolase [Ignavibacteriales bacterium]